MTLLQYNYLDTNIQAGLKGIKLASERKMGVFIMEPLKGGMLADKMPPKAREIIDKSDIQRSTVDLALNWVLNTPEVTFVLSGMNQFDMVKENIQIANSFKTNPLTDKEFNVIENTKKILHEIIKIPCTSCDYCLPCPQEIEISEIFDLYNKKYLFPEKKFKNLHYSDLLYKTDFTDEGDDGSSCVNCGICQSKCPQQLEIPELLKQIDQEYNEIYKEHNQLLNKLIQDDSVIEERDTLYD